MHKTKVLVGTCHTINHRLIHRDMSRHWPSGGSFITHLKPARCTKSAITVQSGPIICNYLIHDSPTALAGPSTSLAGLLSRDLILLDHVIIGPCRSMSVHVGPCRSMFHRWSLKSCSSIHVGNKWSFLSLLPISGNEVNR